jgi:peptidoglycan/LPS O-acetylase OafA/YrhL
VTTASPATTAPATTAPATTAPAAAPTAQRSGPLARTVTGRATDHRSAGLDFLRALAAVLVVVFHLRTMLVVDFGPLNPVIEGGNSGVYIFFALSGYLLYRPFLRGEPDLRSYALKRAARILPGYFVALTALVLLTRNQLFFEHPLSYLTITSSYDTPMRGFLGVAWTLSAEVAFYVMLPFAARLVAGRELPRLLMIGIASICLNLIHRLLLSDSNLWLIGSFPVVAYAFIPGMVLAVVENKHAAAFRRFAGFAWLALGTVLIVVGCLQLADPIALPTGVGAALAMGWLLQHRVPGARVLAFAGGASYALYLWHRDLFIAFGLAGLPLAIGGSFLSWAIVERPILDWAHRLASRWRVVPPHEPTDPIAAPSAATS